MTEVPRFPLSPFLSLSFCIRIGFTIMFIHSSISSTVHRETALPAENLTTNLVHRRAILSPSFHTAITIHPEFVQRHKNYGANRSRFREKRKDRPQVRSRS